MFIILLCLLHSVISLIQHLYEPSAGSITIDGIDVSTVRFLDEHWLICQDQKQYTSHPRENYCCKPSTPSQITSFVLFSFQVHEFSPRWLSQNVSIVSQVSHSVQPWFFAKRHFSLISYCLDHRRRIYFPPIHFSQEPTLFARSIKRNIMYGLEGTPMEPTDEEIYRVAKLANADKFIEVSAYLTIHWTGK